MPLLQTFLAVAIKPGQTVSDMAKAAGVPNGTMSRQLADLSPIGRAGDPGLGASRAACSRSRSKAHVESPVAQRRGTGPDDCRCNEGAGDGEGGLTSLRWATSTNLDEKVVRFSGILSLA